MTGIVMNSQLFAPLFSSAAVRAIVNDRARLQRMLDFEAALARAEAALGVISATAAGETPPAAQPGGDIVVTGTRIVRPNVTAAAPITSTITTGWSPTTQPSWPGGMKPTSPAPLRCSRKPMS